MSKGLVYPPDPQYRFPFSRACPDRQPNNKASGGSASEARLQPDRAGKSQGRPLRRGNRGHRGAAHGPRLRCRLGGRCRGGALWRGAGGSLRRPVRRHAYPDLRAHRAHDRGLHRGHHDPDGPGSHDRPTPRERHGHGLHRGHAGRRLPDSVRRPQARSLRHLDALHGDLGPHVRDRLHPDHHPAPGPPGLRVPPGGSSAPSRPCPSSLPRLTRGSWPWGPSPWPSSS